MSALPVSTIYAALSLPRTISPPAAIAARPIMALNVAILQRKSPTTRSLTPFCKRLAIGETLSELEIAPVYHGGAGLAGPSVRRARLGDAAILARSVIIILDVPLVGAGYRFDPPAIITLAGRSPACSTVWM